MRAPIWLKFGIRIGSLKANPSIDFQVDLIKIQKFVSDLHINQSQTSVKPTGLTTLRNKLKNQYVARLDIRGVPFGGQKSIEYETAEI